MHIVIAPDSYKGSLTAVQVCEVIQKAIQERIPDATTDMIPMADGGEGTLDALLTATNGKRIDLVASGPKGTPISASYGILGDGHTAIIETAQFAGLTLLSDEEKNPLLTTTIGVGESIRHALNQGYRRFIVGLGGSATNDGGMGCLSALGAKFLDRHVHELPPYASSLSEIAIVDFTNLDSRVKEAEIRVACDVDNPLCGPHGASFVYGPQKGATPEQVEWLDRGLSRYATLIETHLQSSFQNTPGAGAAGGLGFAFLTLGAKLVSGAALVAEASRLEERIEGADWVITGEGKTDPQTLRGKVPFYVANLAKKKGVKTILISGSVEGGHNSYTSLFDHVESLVSDMIPLGEAIKNAKSVLYQKVRDISLLLG